MIVLYTDWMSLVVCASEFDRVCEGRYKCIRESLIVRLKYLLNGLSYILVPFLSASKRQIVIILKYTNLTL